MIVVSGAARTGTSMMMQTLVHLGYDTVAPKFLDIHKNVVDYNPKGFYELDLLDIQNVDYSDYKKAIKVFGVCFPYFNMDLVEKLIVMNRDRDTAVKSSLPVFEGLGDGKVDAGLAYDSCYKIIDEVFKEVPTIFINFEEIISNPNKEVNRLVDFLGKDFAESDILKAIENIKH